MAQRYFGLVKQPVGGRAIAPVLRRQRQTRNPEHAVRAAANVQAHTVYVQLLHPTGQQGTGRNARCDRNQRQRRMPLGVKHLHIAQFHRRNQSIGLRGNAANAHHGAHSARGLRLQPGAQIVDSRHNDKVQRQPHQHQQQPSCGHQAQGPFGEKANG